MIDNLLLCVGAQKTGTTWLHSQLKDHPEIRFSNVKEVHYFNTVYNGSILLTTRKVEHIKQLIENNRFALEKYFSDLSSGNPVDKGIEKLLSKVDDEWYIDLLKTDKKYAADFTPEYAILPSSGFKNIKKVSKRQKIIFIMRDPIKRALSAIQYFYQMHDRDINSESDEQIFDVARKSFILGMSKYEETIKKLELEFNSSDVLYLFFEEMMSDKQQAINKVTEFLNIESVCIPKDKLEKKVNTSTPFDFSDSLVGYLRDNLVGTYEYIEGKHDSLPIGWSSR